MKQTWIKIGSNINVYSKQQLDHNNDLIIKKTMKQARVKNGSNITFYNKENLFRTMT